MAASKGKITDEVQVAKGTGDEPVMVGNEIDPNAEGYEAANPDRLKDHEAELRAYEKSDPTEPQSANPDEWGTDAEREKVRRTQYEKTRSLDEAES